MATLKVVIAGSRGIEGEEAYTALTTLLSKSLAKHAMGTPAIVIISGGAKGVDQMAKRYALENAFAYREFAPEYRGRGDRDAPLRRNKEMAVVGHILVALWNGSPGTRHMIATMKRAKKPVYFEMYTQAVTRLNKK
jgi:hypothetical protein